MLSWQICASSGAGAPDVMVAGDKTLDAATARQLESALDALHATDQPCGGDVSDRIEIVSTGGTRIYDPAQCVAGEQAVLDLVSSAAGG